MFADFWQLSHALDHAIGHVLRVRSHKAYALQPFNDAEMGHQIGEVWLIGQIEPVRLNGLSEQRDFFGPFGDQGARLDHQLIYRTAALASPARSEEHTSE